MDFFLSIIVPVLCGPSIVRLFHEESLLLQLSFYARTDHGLKVPGSAEGHIFVKVSTQALRILSGVAGLSSLNGSVTPESSLAE